MQCPWPQLGSAAPQTPFTAPPALRRPQDDEFRQDAFYAWTRERPRSAWFYFASFLVVLGIVAVTLFPLAPQWLKCAARGRQARAAGPRGAPGRARLLCDALS